MPDRYSFDRKKSATTMNLSVVLSSMVLNRLKKPSRRLFFCSPGGFSSDAASAGLNVSALMDEMPTEIAMVIANC